MREHLRAIVWPRGEEGKTSIDGKPIYRYAIVGMLITDQKLEFMNDTEVMIDSRVMIGQQLATSFQRKPNLPTGEASSVLCSLDIL